MSELEYPENLRYTADHEWVEERDEGTLRIGITSYAQNALGDVVYVSLPAWATPSPRARRAGRSSRPSR